MATQMGRWEFDESQVLASWVEKMQPIITGNSGRVLNVFSHGSFAVLHHGAHFAEMDGSGNRPGTTGLLWDGRLDNGSDLANELGLPRSSQGDVTVVAAAYQRWGDEAFRKIIGDWALVLWSRNDRSLLLARDPIGLKPLFYSLTESGVQWSSALELLVQHPGRTLSIDLEYLAGWLALFPRADSTPYSEVRAVPPSSFIRFQRGRLAIHKYWDFDSSKSINLRDDSEYEEQFRANFASAVRRRLRSSRPLLAELSGGMDSTSIVCVADQLIAHEHALTTRLDTISYFDDTEPNWNERPYFTAVETKRGRTGYHVQIDSKEELRALVFGREAAVVPAKCGDHSARVRTIATLIDSGGYGAILSGIGGDEFLGGVPTAVPELADLIAGFRFGLFWPRVMSWAMAQRRPWFHLCVETLGAFAPSSLGASVTAQPTPAWILPRFGRRYRDAFRGYVRPLTFSGAKPSFQENLSTLEAIRRQIASSSVSSMAECDKRFPYLDRDLLEFLFAIPREQIIKPGKRRFLMRQSLTGIVPDEILTRKRKAYVTQAPRVALAALWTEVMAITTDMVSESLGIVSSMAFRQALHDLRAGTGAAIIPVFRTLMLECWLRSVGHYSFVSDPVTVHKKRSVASIPAALTHSVHNRSSAG